MNAILASLLVLAAGFFRIEEDADGRWRVFDPDGKETVLLGIDHVTERGHYCEKLGRFTHLEKMQAKYPDKEDWRKETIARLKRWGFNMLGAGSDEDLKHRGLAHTAFLSMGDSWSIDRPEEFWICPNEHRPCSAFPNVFHPEWPKHCEEVAAELCRTERDDPMLFGYFIDNELAWWGRGEEWGTSKTGLYEEALKRPEGHYARTAAEKIRGEAGEEKAGEEFLKRAAELYFSTTTAAIRKVDPNHLVLGARFAGLGGANPVVWEIAGKYTDLVTFNIYPWADLDRNIVVNDAWNRREPVRDVFERFYRLVKKPFLITEWSFPALDSGLPCTYGAGQRFSTQAERTAATELFAKTMLATPFVVGYDYFMWVDEPALGISSAFPENSNYGLTNEEGEAYPEITEMFERLHRDVLKWRYAPFPEENKTAVPRPLAGDMIPGGTVLAPVSAGGGNYCAGDAESVVLRGSIGGRHLFDEVIFNGEVYGNFNILVSFNGPSGYLWCETWKVLSAETDGDTLVVTAFGGEGNSAYEAKVAVRVFAGTGKALAEVREIRQTGENPYGIDRVFLQPNASFAGEVPPPREVPSLWKAPVRSAWLSNDGRFFGAYTRSESCSGMNFWTDSSGGVHADATFGCGDAEGFFAMLCVGRGGEEAWKKEVR
ncbi:MAG: hypothetical protein ILO34_06950 [Kiritimatiellae bacterium]|nr:hypothetical protein [Kiritimatiellia bacterium]